MTLFSELKLELTVKEQIAMGKESSDCSSPLSEPLDPHRERPEDIAGVGGQEGRRLLDYIKERCGKLE